MFFIRTKYIRKQRCSGSKFNNTLKQGITAKHFSEKSVFHLLIYPKDLFQKHWRYFS